MSDQRAENRDHKCAADLLTSRAVAGRESSTDAGRSATKVRSLTIRPSRPGPTT